MELIRWIHAGPFAEYIRNSSVVYPLLQVMHLCGIAIAVGSAITGNVRVLGAAGDLPLGSFHRHVYRWAACGLALVLLSGVPMAVSFIAVFAVNPVMGLKLVLLAIALVLNVYLGARRWADDQQRPPATRERWMAGLSLMCLLGVVAMGKLLAYIGGKD